MSELITEIIKLRTEINAIYDQFTPPLYRDLHEKSCLELAEIYHELKNMLP